MYEQLQRQAEAVAKLRAVVAKITAELDASRQRWAIEHAPEVALLGTQQAELLAAENELRTLATRYYEQKPESKRLPFGLGIRVVNRLAYDAERAVRWAIDHGIDSCLKLDSKKFEAFCRVECPDFVTSTGETTATIPTDLASAVAYEKNGVA